MFYIYINYHSCLMNSFNHPRLLIQSVASTEPVSPFSEKNTPSEVHMLRLYILMI